MTAPDQTVSDRHALQFWEPKRSLTLDAARRHSVFIVRLRQALLALSVLLCLALVFYFVKTPKKVPTADNPDETVRMINPIYKGRTSDGLPFRIIADNAVQLTQSPDEVNLINPILNFLRNDDAVDQSVVLAKSGVYNSKTEVLVLRTDVDLKTDDGYDCQTTHARIFVKAKRIEGDEPISCTGGFGKAFGNAYEVNDNYAEFVFKKNMTALIVPDKADEALAAPQELRGGQ